MLLWLRKRKAHNVARKLLKSFRRHDIVQATVEAKVPRWYFRNDIVISRDDRLRKMTTRVARYIEQATGRQYRVEVIELLESRVRVEAHLRYTDNPTPSYTPTPRSS